MPPADMIPEIIRGIVEYMNITSAAILYDSNFVMDHKYKALPQNIPTRHVITSIAKDDQREQQIEKLRNLDINNFFILGSHTSIKNVLCNYFFPFSRYLRNYVKICNISKCNWKIAEAAKREYFERNFAWHAITQYRGDISCNCDNATIMFVRPMPDSAARDRLGLMKTTYNLKHKHEISSAFYFDLALWTFLAVKDMQWINEYLTCDDYDGTNTPERKIDLKSYFKAVCCCCPYF